MTARSLPAGGASAGLKIPHRRQPRSGRFVSHPDARLALPEAGKLPNAGARGIDIGGDIDVD
jgi:hypothetical protein